MENAPLLRYFSVNGNLFGVQLIHPLVDDVSHWDDGILQSARNGYLEIFKILIDKVRYKDGLDRALELAIQNRNLNIVKIIILQQTDKWLSISRKGIVLSAIYGDLESAEFIRDHSLNTLDKDINYLVIYSAIDSAIFSKNTNALESFIKWNWVEFDFERAMRLAELYKWEYGLKIIKGSMNEQRKTKKTDKGS